VAFTAAELKAIATLENTQFKTAVAEVEQNVSSLANGALSQIGSMIGAAFTVGAIVNFGFEVMNEARQLENLSKVVGMSAGTIHELDEAVEVAGGSAEGFNSKIVRMLDSQEKAILGNKELAESFARMGISMADLKTLSPEDLLMAIAKGAQTSATAIRDLNQIMGKGAAAEYGGVLKDLAADQDQFAEFSKRSADATESVLAKAQSKLTEFKNELKAAGKGFLAFVLDPFGTISGANTEQQYYQEMDRKAQEKSRLDSLSQLAAEEDARKREESNKKIADKMDETLKREHTIEEKSIAQQQDSAVRAGRRMENIIVTAPRAADSMAAYGRNIGGNYSSDNGAMERMIKEQEITNEHFEEQVKIIEETNRLLAGG